MGNLQESHMHHIILPLFLFRRRLQNVQNPETDPFPVGVWRELLRRYVEAGVLPSRGRLGTGCKAPKPDPRPRCYFCDMRVGGQGGGDAGVEVESGAFDVEVVLEVQALAFFLVPG